jgi:hypothetical protein
MSRTVRNLRLLDERWKWFALIFDVQRIGKEISSDAPLRKLKKLAKSWNRVLF